MTKKEFLTLLSDLQQKYAYYGKMHYPKETFDPKTFVLYPGKITLYKHASSKYNYENKNYAFDTDEERINTCKAIREMIEARTDSPDIPYDLHPFPVIVKFETNTDSLFDKFQFLISNEYLFKIIREGRTVDKEWNKTVYTEYKNYKSKKYLDCLDAYNDWFADRGIEIDSLEWDNISLIYQEQSEIIYTKKGQRDKDGLTYLDKLKIKLFELTNETIEIYQNKNEGKDLSISKAVKKTYQLNAKKIFKNTSWGEDSLMPLYYYGKSLSNKINKK